ncbi:MAG TPA: nuclear transport factor 2 family protein [Steroidobacteraceae bacterium]|nr:nuclear transport factor 2 family protein [Steroidobacteraceae bacterium]
MALNEAAAACIEHACERLVLASIRHFDQRDWSAYASLFTPDGVFIRANEPLKPLRGRAEIASALAGRPASRLTRHVCSNIEIEAIDATHANGRCYLLLFAASEGGNAPIEGWPAELPVRVGEYRDEFALTSEGWRIARRSGRLTMRLGL